VFVDEFSVEKDRRKNRYWVLSGTTPTRFAQRKFAKSRERVSVSFLAAFTLKGCVGCFELPRTFTAMELRHCLDSDFRGQVTALLGHRWRLLWDNDGRHHSNIVSSWTSAHAHEVVLLPTHSPDLNPIENIFAPIKTKLEAGQPRTEEDIRHLVQEVWKVYSEHDAQRSFIQSMPKRCSEVVHADGARIAY
jgi:hypothetical protein